MNPHIKAAIDEFHEKSAREIWGMDLTIKADPNLSHTGLTYEKVKRMMDKFTAKRITIGGKQFNVYGYHVYESDGWTVLARMTDEDEYLGFDEPIGDGIIYINHAEGKLMGREEELQRFARNCEPIQDEP
ncbi:MAG TPA: hypothetical protein VJS44_08475 [Pyrinomonadaceae bacterium]|nr:hypothetical protein [Pyrinomonadaceae bacterium]